MNDNMDKTVEEDLEVSTTDADAVVGGMNDPKPVSSPLPKVEKTLDNTVNL